MDASKPIMPDGRTYHLQTREGDIAPSCLLVGSPERAEMIAATMFQDAAQVGDHRGLKSYTGHMEGVPISVVTTGMGSASTGIVLPEAAESGGKRFIRVGSCSTLWPNIQPGSSVICTGAVRLDGASENWAPIEYPAIADYTVVGALAEAAIKLKLPHAIGIGATTTCFNEGAGATGSGRLPSTAPTDPARRTRRQKRALLLHGRSHAVRVVHDPWRRIPGWRRRRCLRQSLHRSIRDPRRRGSRADRHSGNDDPARARPALAPAVLCTDGLFYYMPVIPRDSAWGRVHLISVIRSSSSGRFQLSAHSFDAVCKAPLHLTDQLFRVRASQL